MPIHLPAAGRYRTRPTRRSFGAFGLSCGLLGAAAIGLAAFIDLGCRDRTGATLVLLMASGLIAVLIRGLGVAE